MQSLQKPIGIFGGTFDPVHFGHLRTALELYQALDLQEVKLIPCYQPVHRKMPAATPEQRLMMVKLAIESEKALSVDDVEIKRKGPSYSIDTLEEMRRIHPRTPFCLIMGIDALLSFSSWHRWQEILELANIVVVHRPQYQLPQTGIVADLLKNRLRHSHMALHETLNGVIVLHPVTPLEISATDIRKQFSMGLNPRYLLPNNVYKYIQEHGVYSVSRI